MAHTDDGWIEWVVNGMRIKWPPLAWMQLRFLGIVRSIGNICLTLDLGVIDSEKTGLSGGESLMTG